MLLYQNINYFFKKYYPKQISRNPNLKSSTRRISWLFKRFLSLILPKTCAFFCSKNLVTLLMTLVTWVDFARWTRTWRWGRTARGRGGASGGGRWPCTWIIGAIGQNIPVLSTPTKSIGLDTIGAIGRNIPVLKAPTDSIGASGGLWLLNQISSSGDT